MTTQRYEIEAWLGDFAHELTDEQVDDLVRISDDIADRYPDPDDGDVRQSALIAAHRMMTGDTDVITELGQSWMRASIALAEAKAGLVQAALVREDTGAVSEAEFARQAGVDRMTVREWTGKRRRS